MDADSNGSLSSEELPAPMQTNFAAMDTDSDGKLSLDEYIAGRAKFRRPGGGGPPGAGPGEPGGERSAGGPPTPAPTAP